MASKPGPSTREFVNPYTFVPLGHDPLRELPTGHDRAPGSASSGANAIFSASFTVEWELKTPLLLPVEARQEGWLSGKGAETEVRIPGSATKGVVRNLHETMFNGCLRILDEEYLPAYRDTLRPGLLTGWRLAVVVPSPDGAAQKVALCDTDPLWIDAASLLQAYGGLADSPDLPRSGDVLAVTGQEERDAFGRRILRDVSELASAERPTDQDWTSAKPPSGAVLLVTDTAARPTSRKTREGRRRARAYWAASEITTEEVPVSPAAAQRYASACQGARDMSSTEVKKLERAGIDHRATNLYTKVSWWRNLDGWSTDSTSSDWTHVAERMRATGFLHPGAVVWVRQGASGVVEEIKLAAAWRTPVDAEYGIAERSSSAHAGCTDPDALCLSCATFGMVQAESSPNGRKDGVFAYAGHVRFGDAVATASTTTITCAPQGQPRPSSAGMYLVSEAYAPRRPRGDKRSQWGAAEDAEALRPIAGRKFYWHADPDAQAAFWRDELPRNPDVVPRYQARSHHTDRADSGMKGERREIVPAGTTLRQRITVEDVDLAALAALGAALAPGAAVAQVSEVSEEQICTHLGGGKGLGLGTVRPTIRSVLVWPSASRYTGESSPTPDLSFAAWRTKVEDRCGPVGENLRLVAAVLDREFLGDNEHLVWYPPVGPWSELGRKTFDESFEFFTQYSGERLQGEDRTFGALPALADVIDHHASPRLPNAVEKSSRGGPGGGHQGGPGRRGNRR